MSKATYPFRLDDGGCCKSSHPYEKNDCSVVALAIVTGLPYDTVHSALKRAGRDGNQGFESDSWLQRRAGLAFGGRFKPVKTKRHGAFSDEKPLTVSTFGAWYPKGRFLLETECHVWGMVDGVHHDISRTREQPLTGAWQWIPGEKTLDNLRGIG